MHSAGQAPSLLVSKEEKAIFALLVAAIGVGLIAFGMALAFLHGGLPRPGHGMDAGRLLLALALFSVDCGIAYTILGRWPFDVRSEASMDFKASPDQIWDAISLRDDYPGWKKIYVGVQRLDEPGEVYLIHQGEDSRCPTCKLPRNPDRSGWTRRVEIREARRPHLYRVAVSARGLSGGRKMDELLDTEDHTTELKRRSVGGTRVTIQSTVVRPKAWLAFLTFLGRPVKEELRSLKAHLECTPDETLYGIAAKRMELARNAPQNCNCPEQLGTSPH